MAPRTAGERVRSVRYLLDLTQAELAEAARVSQPLISAVENGSREATDELLDAIAEATGTPLSFFLASPPEVPLGTLRFRKLATARAGESKRVKALFDEAFRVTNALMRDSGYPMPNLPVATSEHVDQDEIERLSIAAREALQIGGNAPVRHLTRACERAGLAVTPLTFPGEDDEAESIGHFGVSHWSGAHETGLIGYFTGGPGDRQRFTIAHEYAHLILHTRRPTAADPEGEANRLGGAILFPYERLEEAFAGPVTLRELVQLKAVWGISIQALIMRGSHAGFIDEQRKTSLFKQLSARGWRRSEPVTVGHEEPSLLWRLLARKFGNPVPYRKIASAVGLSAVILRSLAPSPDRKPPMSGQSRTVHAFPSPA